MQRPLRLLGLLLPALLSCTAMGAWVYDDPSFALRSVTVRRGGMAAPLADSLDMVFVGCNRNDYDLLGEGFTAQLDVAGLTIAQGVREQPVLLATRDTSSFTVTAALRSENFADNAIRAPFELNSRSTVRTPMGDRSLAFSLHGRVDLSDTSSRWSTEGEPRCRPGLSQLQGLFDRRVPLTAPKDPRPRIPRSPGPTTGNPTP